MKCEEILKALNDFIDGELDPSMCEELEEHLKGCNPCQVVVDNIRKTITLYKAGEVYELPPEFHKRLCECLKAKFREKFPVEG